MPPEAPWAMVVAAVKALTVVGVVNKPSVEALDSILGAFRLMPLVAPATNVTVLAALVALPIVTLPVLVPVLIVVAKLELSFMLAAAPLIVRPPVPCSRPVPELTPTAVRAPALVTLKLVLLIRLPNVPLKLRPLVAVLLALAIVMPAAAPGWLTARAVVAVPLVPFTVKPTTLLAVGVIVFSAVLVGTCFMNEPLAGASWTVPLASGNVIVLLAVGSVTAKVVVKPLSVAPWNTSGDAPNTWLVTVRRSVVALPRVVLPCTVRFWVNVTLPPSAIVNTSVPLSLATNIALVLLVLSTTNWLVPGVSVPTPTVPVVVTCRPA